jgi:hypothetical protein
MSSQQVTVMKRSEVREARSTEEMESRGHRLGEELKSWKLLISN